MTLFDDDASSVNRMLIYLYTNDYPDGEIPPAQRPSIDYGPSTSPYLFELASTSVVSMKLRPGETGPSDDAVINNAKVYAVADKYDLPRLKEHAKAKFFTQMQSCPHEDIAPVIRVVFESTPPADRGLREIVIQVCADDIDDIVNHSSILTAIEKYPALSFGIFSKRRELEKKTLEQVTAIEADLRADLAKKNSALERALDRESSAKLEKAAAIDAMEEALIQKDSAVNQNSRMTQERDEALKRESSATKERKAAIDAKMKVLAEKPTNIKQQHQPTQPDKAALSRELKAIEEKNAAIDAKAKAIAQKKLAYTKKDEAIRERDAAVDLNYRFFSIVDACLSKSWTWTHCRSASCGAPGYYWIQRFGGEDDLRLQLRCTVCKCKHDLGTGTGL